MDLETENRIAAILLKEAAQLRREAEKEGVLAYLRQPNARRRPNSRFLTATVLGIQQANRAVDVNEMWRSREKELELDNKLKGKSKCASNQSSITESDDGELFRSPSRGNGWNRNDSKAETSLSKKVVEDRYCREDDGLRDEDVDEFLNSRAKRGRGSIGPRMDETGPYLPRIADNQDGLFAGADHVREERHRAVLGPQKPSPSEDDDHKRRKKHKDSSPGRSKKEHSRKHKSKEKSRDEEKKRRKEVKRHRHGNHFS
ncbi:hypothetical protein Dimus_009748 [Dionaea muscipula]